MAMTDWIRAAGEKIRDTIGRVVPLPQRPTPVPVRVPARLAPRRLTRRYYER